MKRICLFLVLSFSGLAFGQSQCIRFYDTEIQIALGVYQEIKTKIIYESTPMNPYFIGETSADFHSEHPRLYVPKYLDASERELYRVVIKDGQLFGPDGTPVVFPSDHVMNYVMDLAGNFYIFDQKVANYIRHSSIFSGGPIGGAGEMLIVDGVFVSINANSGHYPGSLTLLDQVLSELNQDGVDLKNIKIIRTVEIFTPHTSIPKKSE